MTNHQKQLAVEGISMHEAKKRQLAFSEALLNSIMSISFKELDGIFTL